MCVIGTEWSYYGDGKAGELLWIGYCRCHLCKKLGFKTRDWRWRIVSGDGDLLEECPNCQFKGTDDFQALEVITLFLNKT